MVSESPEKNAQKLLGLLQGAKEREGAFWQKRKELLLTRREAIQEKGGFLKKLKRGESLGTKRKACERGTMWVVNICSRAGTNGRKAQEGEEKQQNMFLVNLIGTATEEKRGGDQWGARGRGENSRKAVGSSKGKKMWRRRVKGKLRAPFGRGLKRFRAKEEALNRLGEASSVDGALGDKRKRNSGQ